MADETRDAPTESEREKIPDHLFGDPENKKYPLRDPEEIRSAASYVEKEHNAGTLSDAKYAEIVARIHHAEKAHGIGAANQDGGGERVDRAEPDPRWERVRRVDLASGELGEHARTPQGGLAVRANLTRTGVFTYVQPDGTVRRELRPPDEVFDSASLKTLDHATLTDDHPDKVTPANWRRVTIGHVAGTPHKAGKFVQGTVHVQHGDAIDKAEKGRLKELSCGYECAIDPTPGVHDGEPYDVVQRHIRYNHVAAGPAGWGRAGPEVRMHLDGGAGVSGGDEGAARYVRGMADKDDANKDRLDALERELGTLRKDNGELRKANEVLQGKVDGFEREKKTRDDGATQDEARKRADADFSAHLEMYKEAESWLGSEWSWKREDGSRKTVSQVRRDLLAHFDPELKLDGRSDEYIAGLCAAEIRKAEKVRDGMAAMAGAGSHLDTLTGRVNLRGDARRAPAQDPDDGDESDPETKKAQDRMTARAKDAWKLPPKRDRRRGDNGRGEVPSQGAFGGGNSGDAGGSLGGGF